MTSSAVLLSVQDAWKELLSRYQTTAANAAHTS
jgi:hypothetical protein